MDTQRGSLAERAYRDIKSMILERRLPGGRVVVEGQLADQLQISRTPVREAIGRLSGEGLLVKQASRSFTVRHVKASEFFQSMRVRELLEVEAVGQAKGRVDYTDVRDLRDAIKSHGEETRQTTQHWRLDDRLHEFFADASGNHVLAGIVRDLRVTTRLFEVTQPFGRVRSDTQEHLEILNAFLLGDTAGAKKAMRHHLRQLQKEVMHELSGS